MNEREVFKRWADKDSKYGLHIFSIYAFPEPIARLIDHGFVVDRAAQLFPEFDGSEVAIISRTYLGLEELCEFPGLKTIPIPCDVFGKANGIWVATVIDGVGMYADAFASACLNLPGHLFAYVISLNLVRAGSRVSLHVGNSNDSHAKVILV